MSSNIKHHLELHLIVLIYGFTAILGRLISLNADLLVAWRMVITVTVLSLIIFRNGNIKWPSRKQTTSYLLVGVIVACHWITFFGAIKIANVSVALGGLASTTLFVSILEPIILKRRFRVLELAIGLLIIIGLTIIFRFETTYYKGLIVALTSAFLAALFTVINKKLVSKESNHSFLMGYLQLAGGATAVIIYLALKGTFNTTAFLPSSSDWLWLSLLAVICTAYPYIATIRLMKNLSAYNITLAINMEPIYGVVLAFFIFGQSEQMTSGFYLGAAIIMASVFAYPILIKFLHPKAK